MAAAAATFMFLLLLSVVYCSAVVEAQQISSSNITLGSFLSPSSTNSSWLSASGRFAFGFYPQGNGFAIGIWFAQIRQHTVVWTRNRDDPPLSGNVTLNLTSDGSLILQITQQDQPKSIADDSLSASWASMLDTGNFVLYNSSGIIFWQSFDQVPTDTILPGQQLLAGQELISNLSETDHSTGNFRLKMQYDGNLVQYPINTQDAPQNAYWGSDTNTPDNLTLNLDADGGYLYLLNSNGSTVWNQSSAGSTPINKNVFHRMTIDVDGIFRVYSLNMDQTKSIWSINWESSTDKCEPKGICGVNSFCALRDQRTVCNCIPGFNFTDDSRQSLGCQATVEVIQGCGNEAQNSNSMYTLANISWEDGPYSVLSSLTEEECKAACLADGNCEAATFQGQECSKQKLPLSPFFIAKTGDEIQFHLFKASF